ncbi:MAG TPA: PilZ domain-containing protein [Azospirillaceae bacterium]|nr:PilZ domain-containing protein [Azospirillaceae bacterium]
MIEGRDPPPGSDTGPSGADDADSRLDAFLEREGLAPVPPAWTAIPPAPGEPAPVERRRHPRTPIEDEVLLLVGGSLLIARGVDVSEGGACVTLESDPPADDTPLTVTIPGQPAARAAQVVAAYGGKWHLKYRDGGE